MIEIKSCPICKSNLQEEFLSCKDFTVSGETFRLVKCVGCDFVFTNPRPDDIDLGKYYKSEDYISHTDTRRGFVSRLYHFVRNYTLRQKVSMVSKVAQKGKIMDYGCGTGAFLRACRTAGWEAIGVEPDEGARRLASGFDLVVVPSLDEIMRVQPALRFDVITLWHVLEHVTALSETLAFFRTKLARGGSLIIAVPNRESYDAKIYGKFWAAYDVPRHLYHFSKSNLSRLMESQGFELREVKPMKFDSYYVSMLSEKYKHGRINYVRAFFKGLMSNLKAESGMNYSSLIYVFKLK